MSLIVPNTAALARFAEAMEKLTDKGGDPSKIGFAVSGGPDSMAMMALAKQHIGTGVKAATVDHGLRAEAADEAAFVARFCAEHGIAHETLKVTTPITGNLQSGARAARYALLDEWATRTGCDWIATAHHADDQLETLLMRVARGAGISGLSGVRARNVRIIRPLLGFTKAELEAICADADIVPCRDPSNTDMDFDRARMRRWLQDAETPFDPKAAVRSASALSEASDALEWAAHRLYAERVVRNANGHVQINPDGIPAELQRRLLLLAIAQIDADAAPRGALMDRALAALRRGEKIMVGEVVCTGGAMWELSLAPPRRSGS